MPSLVRARVPPPKDWAYGGDVTAESLAAHGISIDTDFCKNRWGDVLALTQDGFFTDPFSRTLAGVVGRLEESIHVPDLNFSVPEGLPPPLAKELTCAHVPNPAQAAVHVCLFPNGHCLPFQDGLCHWLHAAEDGTAMHRMIWKDFLGSPVPRPKMQVNVSFV